jgi:hypothetical protein
MRDPLPHHVKDDLLMCCIRRANLDALWGRETQTVNATLRAVEHLVRMWEKVGVLSLLP